MTTEIPQTIQLISVALSIAALAITLGSELAAAPRDTQSQTTPHPENTSSQSWKWHGTQHKQAGFCTPKMSNASSTNEHPKQTASRSINECQIKYRQQKQDCETKYGKKCMASALLNNERIHCDQSFEKCTSEAQNNYLSCREQATQ
jgi:hypothetical protein